MSARRGRVLAYLRRAAEGHTPGYRRLGRTHALVVAGDALVALALAGSLFFSISPDAARSRLALYLLLTMAPFAVVAPFIGPWVDRRTGGHRAMVVLAAAARAGVCLGMTQVLQGLLLFPAAFAVLVLGKAHMVAKNALVPAVVAHERDLVRANAGLAVLSAVAGAVAAGPGLLLLRLGAEWVVLAAAAVFALGTASALRIPRTATQPAVDAEAGVRPTAGVVLAARAMAALRAAVGFLSFLLAFELRRGGAPLWWFGVMVAAGGAGGLLGAAVAPALRRRVHEETMLAAGLAATGLAGLGLAARGGRPSGAGLAAVVGVAAAAGRQAFDAIVQRDAPEGARGAAFARFEARFQLVWVLGAFVPVVVPVSLALGEALVGAGAAVLAIAYVGGLAVARRRPHRPLPPPATVRLADRLATTALAGRVRRALATGGRR